MDKKFDVKKEAKKVGLKLKQLINEAPPQYRRRLAHDTLEWLAREMNESSHAE